MSRTPIPAIAAMALVCACGEKKEAVDALRGDLASEQKRIESLFTEHTGRIEAVAKEVLALKREIERVLQRATDDRNRLGQLKKQVDDMAALTKKIMEEGVHVRISPVPGTPAREATAANVIRLTLGPEGKIYFGDSVNPLPLRDALARLREAREKEKTEVQLRGMPGVQRSALEDIIKSLREGGFQNVVIAGW